MKYSILMGALVLAVALLPSFAAATSTPYDILVDDFEVFEVPGTLLNPPTLSQTEGNAVITSATYDGGTMKWTVRVDCISSSTGHCKGDLVS